MRVKMQVFDAIIKSSLWVIIKNICSYNLPIIKEKVVKLEKTNYNKQKKDR